METFCAKVRVGMKQGVQVRCAARMVQEAQGSLSRVTIRHRDRKADARSILEILCLAAGQGSLLEICAHGSDAQSVVQRLVQFML